MSDVKVQGNSIFITNDDGSVEQVYLDAPAKEFSDRAVQFFLDVLYYEGTIK